MTNQRTDSAKNGADAPVKASFKPYEGPEPYVFVSYSHKDSGRVLPILDAMHAAGYRIWYDEGIPWASRWPEEIEKSLSGCAVCLAFLSASAVESKNCQDEIFFAKDKSKPLLPVYLEHAELKHGLNLAIGGYQAVQWYKPGEAARFIAKLDGQKAFSVCKIPVKPEKPITGTDSNADSGAKKQAASESAVKNVPNQPMFINGKKIYHTDTMETAIDVPTSIGIACALIFAFSCLAFGVMAFASGESTIVKTLGGVTGIGGALFIGGAIFMALYNVPTLYLHNRCILEIQTKGKNGNSISGVRLLYPQYHKGPQEVTSLVIGDGIVRIGNWMFMNYTALKNVTIPDSVINIGAYAFRNCEKLQTVSVPLNAVIAKNAFPVGTKIIRRGEPPKVK